MTSSVECDFGFASPRTEQACDGLTRAGMQGFKRFASTIESILASQFWREMGLQLSKDLTSPFLGSV